MNLRISTVDEGHTVSPEGGVGSISVAVVQPLGPGDGGGFVQHTHVSRVCRPGCRRGQLPDESTILRFRHLLEAHSLNLQTLAIVNATLGAKGPLLKSGMVVVATLTTAPSSTKNSSGERDLEMHQTKKGNQWHFGMKAHIGEDADSGLVYAVAGTAAQANDVTRAHALVHGEESDVFADTGYQGVSMRDETQGIDVNWHLAMRPGKRRVWTRARRWARSWTSWNRTRC
jgi:IS5 family transposase